MLRLCADDCSVWLCALGNSYKLHDPSVTWMFIFIFCQRKCVNCDRRWAFLKTFWDLSSCACLAFSLSRCFVQDPGGFSNAALHHLCSCFRMMTPFLWNWGTYRNTRSFWSWRGWKNRSSMRSRRTRLRCSTLASRWSLRASVCHYSKSFLKMLRLWRACGVLFLQCDVCGMEPIQGTRWHCQSCPPENSVDFCSNCTDWWVKLVLW